MTTIVTTTINVPTFLEGYRKNIEQHGHDEPLYIVVGDRKSHPDTSSFCKKLPNCIYLDVPSQEAYMRKFPALGEHLPFNSIERRNIGMLLAYERGAEVIITLDDDNFSTNHDVLKWHGAVGEISKEIEFSSSSGWFNVCSALEERNEVEFYHRGYPSEQRWRDGELIVKYGEHKSVVNAGLWLDNPDIDAITRLERELYVEGYKIGHPRHFALAPGTWSPFDCQNTALAREVIPAYFLSPCIGRHSDILASYVVNRLTEHFGHVIAFGNPLALHTRTPHNLWKDLDIEREGMSVTDSFCNALRGMKITASAYHEGFGQIVDGLSDWAELTHQQKVLDGMRLWHEAFNAVMGK